MSITKGDWYVMPSGKTVQVCEITSPIEAMVRYMNNNAIMSQGFFTVTLALLLNHARHVKVTPSPTVEVKVPRTKKPRNIK